MTARGLPAQPDPPTTGVMPYSGPQQPADDAIRAQEVWGFLVRNWWLVCASFVGVIAAAAALTARATPVFQAEATLRIIDKEPNLPEIFRTLSAGSAVITEAEVLRSRTLAEDAVARLALQVRLLQPQRVTRDEVFRDISVSRSAPPSQFELQRQADGRYRLSDSAARPLVGATVAPGERLDFPGGALTLRQGINYPVIRFMVQPFDAAVGAVIGPLEVSQPSHDAQIVTVRYRHADRQLVWQVPNAIVQSYLARRREAIRSDARGSVDFLRRQLDTTSAQLAAAENELRTYRERSAAISPQTEASGQVSRIITMQSERANAEGERAALAKLVKDIQAEAAHRKPDDVSPFRELLAFPTLLRSQAAGELLQAMSTVERDRAALLARRTPEDPDVQALTGRMRELAMQLKSVVGAYLQGLSNQIAAIDTSLAHVSQQLGAIPKRELEVARLERKAKILEGVYTLLQTRLKEAEIAGAAQDPGVRLVDSAAAGPRAPIRPRPALNLVAGAVGGLLLGMTLAFVRELRDGAVHTRADVQSATGLPVLGLIPRIRGGRKRIALIADKRRGHTAGTGTARHAHRGRRRSVSYVLIAARLGRDGGAHDGGGSGSARTGEADRSTETLHLAISRMKSGVGEAYGMLRTNILFCRPDVQVKALVITSALPGEGKTTSAINLALTLAEHGMAVLLLDADLRRGIVHNVFEVPREPGLSDVLSGAVPFAAARHRIEIGNGRTVHYLTAGSPVSNASGVVDSPRTQELLAQLKNEYDAVLIDSPPANLAADAAWLGASADGVIVVARAGVTESAALACAMEQLRHVRAPVLGVVLNDVDFKRDSTYDGAYRYYDPERYARSSTD